MDGHNYVGRFTVFPGNNFKYHLIPFQAAFSVGAAAIMPNYTIQKMQYDVNPLQVPSAFSYELITLIAKKQIGFKGVVTNDWCTMGTCGGIGGNGYGTEGLSWAERAALHLHAGSHQLGNESVQNYTDAYTQGLITLADVNAAATRILEMIFKLGLFENPYQDSTQAATIARSAANRQLAYDSMKEAIVLLRNTDHLGGSNRYLPINGSRLSGTSTMADTNKDGLVSVYYDGEFDSISSGTSTDDLSDLLGAYDYASASSTGVAAVVATSDITTADLAVIRIASRGSSQTAGIPLSYDGVLTPEQLSFGTDGTLAAAAASKKKVLDAFRVRDGYKKSDGTVVAALNPTLKVVLVVAVARPPIVRPSCRAW